MPRPTIDELIASREGVNRASADFLKIDLRTALTFVKIAQQTTDDVRKERNRMAARRAYETVKKLAQKVSLNDDEMQAIMQSLMRLRSELEALGETI